MSRHGRLERIRSELEARKLIRATPGKATKELRPAGVGERLAGALPAIGPLFALFGRYLAERTDCLPLRDCRELGRIRIAVDPTPMARIGGLLSMHIGGPLADHFSAFDEPRRTTLLHQWHNARLRDGTEVTVKLVRPEARALIDTELELLPALEELDIDPWNAQWLIEGFVVWLDRQLDLGQEVVGLDRLAAEIGAFDAFEVPTVLHELCSRDIAVTHRTGGTPLGEMIAATDKQRPKLARCLCQAWLQQSLLEGACPEGPLSDHVLALSDERFAITGGLVTTLDPRWRRHLIDAIIATARDDPDRVCGALLAECTELEGAADVLRVRSELRQAETFRSGGWTDEFAGRRIADEFLCLLAKAGPTGLPTQGPRHCFHPRFLRARGRGTVHCARHRCHGRRYRRFQDGRGHSLASGAPRSWGLDPHRRGSRAGHRRDYRRSRPPDPTFSEFHRSRRDHRLARTEIRRFMAGFRRRDGGARGGHGPWRLRHSIATPSRTGSRRPWPSVSSRPQSGSSGSSAEAPPGKMWKR